MNQQLISTEFIVLCIIQLITLVTSLIILITSFKHYLNIDRSKFLLRKSVKYFTLLFVSIASLCVFSLVLDFYYLATLNSIISGYLFSAIVTTTFANIFCAFQFLVYLLHPERRYLKYPLGIYCLIGIILQWIFPPIFTDIFQFPKDNTIIFIYLYLIYLYVYIIFAYEFLYHSWKSADRKERNRFLCIGLSAVLFIVLLPVGLLGHGKLIMWLLLLSATSLLYLGYNFPKFFQKFLKVDK
ncbi:MAG TPA: hypothetical protein VMV49_11485 [Candidatus Deferrimicrobium sp.]|nr:hypothetical protein [Candidatus Deferrimicrobium sp.]